MRVKLTIEYCGLGFCGWQKQNYSHNVKSVQECVERAISKVFGGNPEIQLFCAGRTDAGVHALGQVAHFDIIDDVLADRWRYKICSLPKAINYHLNVDGLIAARCASVVDDGFHARFSASMRHYRYVIYNSYQDRVFTKNMAWHIHKPLNIKKMRESVGYFLGRHDFTSFCSTQSSDNNMLRTISRLDVSDNVDGMINIDISAKSFLHNQVRIIVGTLVDVGLGIKMPQDIKQIIDSKNRTKAGQTAPAYGLFFVRVDY